MEFSDYDIFCSIASLDSVPCSNVCMCSVMVCLDSVESSNDIASGVVVSL